MTERSVEGTPATTSAARLVGDAQVPGPPRTRDLLPPQRAVFLRLEHTARDLAIRYGYAPIETPMFEGSAVYERGVGEVTDVVEKELFRVQAGRADSERERWALRPEPTAGIVRAYVQHGMRPAAAGQADAQRGRCSATTGRRPAATASSGSSMSRPSGTPVRPSTRRSWSLGYGLLRRGRTGDVEVLVNSIGDSVCRPAYVEAVEDHFRARADGPAGVGAGTTRDNPLRLVDSKDERMRASSRRRRRSRRTCATPARRISRAVRRHLAAVAITPRPAPRLVRGLDYYTRTAFEFQRPGAEGQQQALGGGGRYDGLVELLGGRPTPGIGFGLGLDRVILALAEQGAEPATVARPSIVVVGADPADSVSRLRVATEPARRRPGGPGRPRGAQAGQAARGCCPGGRSLRGDLR